MSKFTDYANLASNLAQNAQLSEIESLLSKQGARLADADAKATKQAALRESLFQIQKAITETIEKNRNSPFLLAWSLLYFKEHSLALLRKNWRLGNLTSLPYFDASLYSAWDDKERADALGKLVEKTIAECREKLGDADYQKLVSAVNFQVGEKAALTDYDETMKKFELSEAQAATESESARKAEEKVKQWEGERAKWLPYRVGLFPMKLTLYVGLLSFLVMVPSCMSGGRSGWLYSKAEHTDAISTTDLLFGGSLTAFFCSIPAIVVFAFILYLISEVGKKHYGPRPTQPAWPTKTGADLKEWEQKQFPEYMKWRANHEKLQAELASLTTKHGVLSRAEIAARLTTGQELFASLAKKYESGVSE